MWVGGRRSVSARHLRPCMAAFHAAAPEQRTGSRQWTGDHQPSSERAVAKAAWPEANHRKVGSGCLRPTTFKVSQLGLCIHEFWFFELYLGQYGGLPKQTKHTTPMNRRAPLPATPPPCTPPEIRAPMLTQGCAILMSGQAIAEGPRERERGMEEGGGDLRGWPPPSLQATTPHQKHFHFHREKKKKFVRGAQLRGRFGAQKNWRWPLAHTPIRSGGGGLAFCR